MFMCRVPVSQIIHQPSPEKDRKKEARIRQIPPRHQDSSPSPSPSPPPRSSFDNGARARRRRSGMSQHCIEVALVQGCLPCIRGGEVYISRNVHFRLRLKIVRKIDLSLPLT